MFQRCREAGINFFDTANVYAAGRSEEILGKLIAPCRDEIIISSKVGFSPLAGINVSGLSRRHLMLAVEASLKRLMTDRLDFYFLHGLDPKTPLDETLRALDDLVHQGKILYPAVSNWAAWQIATALGTSAREGLARFQCIQPMYSLVKRQAEIEIFPLAMSEKLGAISFSPLASGLLSGDYDRTRKPERGRLVENPLYVKRYGNPVYYTIAGRLRAHAKDKGLSAASLAIAWVMSHPAITAPIIGADNMDQLELSLGALDIQMTSEWRDEISHLSREIEPAPATDRSEEKSGLYYTGWRPHG